VVLNNVILSTPIVCIVLVLISILTVEWVIAVWGQSTVTPDTSIEYTQIDEQPQAAEYFRYPQPSILSAQLCHTAVSVFSLSLRLTFVSRRDL